MLIYFILITFILFFQLPFFKQKKNQKNLLLLIIILLLISGLRGNGSGDYFTYLSYSKLITSPIDVFNTNFPMEIGFRGISFLVNSMGLSSQWVIIIMNLISLTFIYKFIEEYSNDYRFSIFLFLPIFFMFDMHAARTAVAISIGTYGLKYILKQEFLKFLLIILFAMCFHKVALILIFIYFLQFMKKSSFFYIGTIPIAIFLSFLDIYKLLYLISSRLQFTSFSEKIFSYSANTRFGYSFSLHDPRLLLSFFLLIFSLIVIERYNSGNIDFQELSKLRLLIKINWLLIMIMIIFSSNTLFVIRIYGFYYIYSIIQIPLFLNKYKNLTNKQSYLVVKIIIIFIYLLYLLFILKDYPPYFFFFQN